MSDAAAPKPKSKKKLLVIVIVLVVVLALAGVGAMMFLKKKNTGGEEDGEEAVAETSHSAPAHDNKNPPTFLPIDNLVVNLADPGGERFAQIGITFQLADAHSGDTLKTSMPRVRSAILMLVSSRTSEELLSREGKEKLAKNIAGEASRAFGIEPEDEDEEEDPAPKKKKKKKRAPASPVQAVLFSSFIVQ